MSTQAQVARTVGDWSIHVNQNDIQIVSPWTYTNRPVEAATFGSCLGAHVAEMQFLQGVLASKEQALANAEFIVRACNAHDDLLAACESMLKTCGSSADWNGETHESLKLIEAAILKARGETP